MTITQNHIVDFIALISSLFAWKEIKKGKYRDLPFFLFFILCIELTGNYLKSNRIPNVPLYNFSIPLEYLYFLLLFYRHGRKNLKILCLTGAIIISFSSAISFFYLPYMSFHRMVLLICHSAIIICCCTYFYERFYAEIFNPVTKNYFFWLCAGLLFFNLGELSYTVFFPTIHENGWDPLDKLFKAVNNNLVLVLYVLMTISILIHKKEYHQNA